jgi:hypothetical protein
MPGESLEATILTHLRAYPGKRFTRADLVYRMKTCGFLAGLSDDRADRQVRKALQRLRSDHPDGAWICSSSEDAGYFFGTTEAEIEAAQAEDLSRMQATSAKVENRRRLLRSLEQARTMEGRLL